MTKAVIRLGYTDYVMPLDRAVVIAEMLIEAERYHTKGYGEETTYHVWEEHQRRGVDVTVIPEHIYRTGKAAGKPDNK